MIVTVVDVYVMTGAEIRPVAGVPSEQAVSQTRMWRSVVMGVGAGNAGSSAHVAGPKSAESAHLRVTLTHVQWLPAGGVGT